MNLSLLKIGAVLCRWIARLSGAFLVMAIVSIAIGEGMPNPFTQPLDVQTGFLSLAIWMAGILAAWRWELGGSIVSLAGWLTFVVVAIHSPRGMTWFIALMALPGLLYIASAVLRRNQK